MAIDSLNAVALLRAGLERQVKESVVDVFVREEMKAIEERLRPRVRELVEQISFKAIDRVTDVCKVRDELHVFLKWQEEE
jgi:flagellar biosynthesis component FlhA